MPPRFDVSSIRRDQILVAARELFVQRGVANVKLDEIAAKLDVSKAALYLYYPGKDAIVAAVLDQYTAQLRRELGAALAQGGSLLEQLLAAVSALQSPALPVRFRSEVIGIGCTSEIVAEAMRVHHRMTVQLLTDWFRSLAARGELVDVAPDVAARRILYLSEGILIVRATVDDPDTVSAETEAIIGSFAASYMPRARAHAAAL